MMIVNPGDAFQQLGVNPVIAWPPRASAASAASADSFPSLAAFKMELTEAEVASYFWPGGNVFED
jgi:hypothetical protein